MNALVVATPISGPHAQVDAGVGLAGDRRADDVDDAQRERAALLGLLQRRERVGGLAGLADRDDDRAVLDDRVAVAELAGVLDLGGDLREILHQVLADHAPRAAPCPAPMKMTRSRRTSSRAKLG